MNYHKVPPKISRDPIEVQGQKHDQGKPMISLMEKAMEKYGAKVSGEHSGGSVSYYNLISPSSIKIRIVLKCPSMKHTSTST